MLGAIWPGSAPLGAQTAHVANIAVPAVTGLSSPTGIVQDSSGNLFIADTGNNRVVKAPWTGSGLSAPEAVAVDPSGNVYIADTGNNRIVKVPWTGSPELSGRIPHQRGRRELLCQRCGDATRDHLRSFGLVQADARRVQLRCRDPYPQQPLRGGQHGFFLAERNEQNAGDGAKHRRGR